MYILGISGSLELLHEHRYHTPSSTGHDASACLLKDGNIVAAIEEERLNRIKHTNKFPVSSIKFCLDSEGISLGQVDYIAYYAEEENLNAWLKLLIKKYPDFPKFKNVRESLHFNFKVSFNIEVDLDRIIFVPHQIAHAWSVYGCSGYSESLVLTLDAQGDSEDAGIVLRGSGLEMELLRNIHVTRSLGGLYLRVIRAMGFRIFDEYKVMGLAPYGDPSVYREFFETLFVLLPDGDWEVNFPAIPEVAGLVKPEEKDFRASQTHKNIAAALQETLEKIVFHGLDYWRGKSGMENLCLAGGVAQNSTMNGKILRSGLFKRVFVQPAASDSGCSLGAALSVHVQKGKMENKGENDFKRLEHVYLGTYIQADVVSRLNAWSAFIDFETSSNIIKDAAEALASGAVLGWVQGRSEFGPRALGNRSILADPRPFENRTIINEIVKKREEYRPFAPAVPEEAAINYFELGNHVEEGQFNYMTFVMGVKLPQRALLAAVTHVDGSARVQTVSRHTNPKFWELLMQFGGITGVPILLNTSFNNHFEPIVDSVDDAVICLLTTGLNYMVVENCMVRKRQFNWESLLRCYISLPRHLILSQKSVEVGLEATFDCCEIRSTHESEFVYPIGRELFQILSMVEGSKTLGELLSGTLKQNPNDCEKIVHDIIELWSLRLVNISPNVMVSAPIDYSH
jgi:carbamoyltransferase